MRKIFSTMWELSIGLKLLNSSNRLAMGHLCFSNFQRKTVFTDVFPITRMTGEYKYGHPWYKPTGSNTLASVGRLLCYVRCTNMQLLLI